MRAFLCGGGSGEQTKEAYQKFSEVIDKSKPLLYVPIAMDFEKYDECYSWIKEELGEYGVENIEMIKSYMELEDINFNEYCAIFFGGGNTYKLLFELKLGGCMEKIKEYIKNDGVVFGGSAGAIIMGYDIKPCECEDENNVGLVNTEGLDVLNGVSILCHYTNREVDKNEINRRFLIDLSNERKIIALPEEDTIYVDNEGIGVYGDRPYYIFDKGNINIIEKEKDRN